MPSIFRTASPYRWSIAFPCLLLLLGTLWLAGGASQADVAGQVVTRAAAWLLLIVAIIFGGRPTTTGTKPVLLFLAAAIFLVLLQLVPLPPGIWQMLPGRKPFTEVASASGPWRPWSIVPEATINAASSLIVPVAVLLFVNNLEDRERRWLPGALLGLILASALVGLLQLSGTRFDNPMINDVPWLVSGTFANRNHFALYLAFGCLLAPVWAFAGGRRARWRGPAAIGLVLLFALTILATGSRAGALVGALALGFGLALSWQGIQREFRRVPRWIFLALVAAIVGMVVFFVLISIAADRAESINRAFTIDTSRDMRSRGLPTMLAMIQVYFPIGAGFGSFDPIFRIHEPFELLQRSYFNHAHNDFLEIVLDGGLPALLLLVAAIGWWLFASIRVWRAGAEPRYVTSRLGSSMLLLVIIASVFDYPARTPMMMAMIVIAAAWLSQGAAAVRWSALPKQDQHL